MGSIRPTWRAKEKRILDNRALTAPGVCSWCRREDEGEIDHLVELWDGGKHAPFNTQRVCHECHKSKPFRPRDVHPVDWRLFLIDATLKGRYWLAPRRVDKMAVAFRRSFFGRSDNNKPFPLDRELARWIAARFQ
jgi:hypothetical protein